MGFMCHDSWLAGEIHLSFSSFNGRIFTFVSSGISGIVLVGVFLYFLLRQMKELKAK